MPGCPKCRESLSRTHRRFWEKLIYSVVFRCRNCDFRVGVKQDYIRQFVLHTVCPRCGTVELDKRKTRDRIDKVIYSPMSTLSMMLGGSLYHCLYCRIQFYDLRSRPAKPAVNPAVTGEISQP